MNDIQRYFFLDSQLNNTIYFIDCDIKNDYSSQKEKDLLNQIVLRITNLLFPNLFNISKEKFRNFISDVTIVGPITSFESVFSNTTKDLLNSNVLTKKFELNFIKFEKLRVLCDSELNLPNAFDVMLEQIYGENLLLGNLDNSKTNESNIPFDKIIQFDEEGRDFLLSFGVKFDNEEFNYYKDLFNNQANFTELFDLCQSNSEHSRHWFFGGKYYINGNETPEQTSLFKGVKSTLNTNSNSLVAFSDNSSVIKGYETKCLVYDVNYSCNQKKLTVNSVLTAETHNFPTLICPFQGASTGVGGRIRDNHSTGRGAKLAASFAGYCVGDINRLEPLYNTPYQTPIDMLVEASNGASDYGNKIGEPIIGGFTRGIGEKIGKHYEYLKPIMFSAGVGSILTSNVLKTLPDNGDLVVRLGGPAYKIGLGGGFNSSIDNGSKMTTQSKDAVQRGDPQMENKLNRVIQTLSDMEINPIKSIHDQGAGGLGNVVKEIVYPNGAIINLNNVTLGDSSLGPLEIWCSEFQESDVILIDPKNRNIVEDICKLENVNMDVLGEVCSPDYGKIVVYFNEKKIIDFELESVLNPSIRKEYNLVNSENVFYHTELVNKVKNEIVLDLDFGLIPKFTQNILNNLDVCSKRFLTTKVDRSVTGLIAQQQCVGLFQTPVANYGTTAYSYIDKFGTTTAIGERPYLGLFSEKLQAQYTLCEMLTNMVGSYIGNIENIKSSVNWMWANNSNGEAIKLFNTASYLIEDMKIAGVGIDGGKDSLSMMVKTGDEEYPEVVSPGNVVITGYAPCLNICYGLTPDLKDIFSLIIHVPFVTEKFKYNQTNLNLKGSIFSRVNEAITSEYSLPEELNFTYIKHAFNVIQNLVKDDTILSLHDISDGGLITTLFEMCYSGYKGAELNKVFKSNIELINFLFSETPGVLLEISNYNFMKIRDTFQRENVDYELIGMTKRRTVITINASIKSQIKTINMPVMSLCQSYEALANNIEAKQCNPDSVNEEFEFIKSSFKRASNSEVFFTNPPNWYIPEELLDNLKTPNIIESSNNKTVLVLRDEGSNGDNEMVAYFTMLGFSVKNLNMTILENNIANDRNFLNKADGIVFVGGFTYSDIMGGASCWAAKIKNNETIYSELLTFFENKNKFVIGVCNGFQLLIKLGVFGDNITLEENTSGRFESRFLPIEVINYRDKTCEYFKGMEDTTFGIWCAHQMGRISIKSKENNNFVPVLRYIDSRYPLNPNGSDDNIAGIVSKNGKILGLMPHFERSFLNYQLGYIPPEYKNINKSPWYLIGKNIA